jgi:hypothetical protein
MSFLVKIAIPRTDITQTPATSFSNLTATAVSAQTLTPSITGLLDSTATLKWNVFNETLTGFDIFATIENPKKLSKKIIIKEIIIKILYYWNKKIGKLKYQPSYFQSLLFNNYAILI